MRWGRDGGGDEECIEGEHIGGWGKCEGVQQAELRQSNLRWPG